MDLAYDLATPPPANTGEAPPDWADEALAWVARTTWTAADLARLGLEFLPGTERRVREWLERNIAAPPQHEQGRGRGGVVLSWHRMGFPQQLRQAIDRRLQEVLIATGQSSVMPDEQKFTRSQQQLARMSDKMAARAEARAEILDALKAWRAATGRFGWKGQQAFCALYGAGQIAVSAAARSAVGKVCAASIAAWEKRRQASGLVALAGDYETILSAIDGDPELLATAELVISHHPHIRATHLRDVLTTRCPDSQVPTLRSVQRWLAAWKLKNRRTLAHLANPDAHRSKFRPAFGDAAVGIRAPNDEWQADASPADLLLADGKRYALIGVIDVFTRRVRLHVAPTSTGFGIGLVLRRALIDFGVPCVFTTDNGADFTSRHIVRVLRDLEVTHKVTPPFSPERKPFIERAFRTFAHDLVELLPGYIGHDVAGRKAIEARRSFADRLMGKSTGVELRLSPAELQAFADDWCTQRYEHRVHGTLKTTPALMAARHGGTIRRITDERALDVLLAPVAGENGRRTVTKKGIRIEGGAFIAAELGRLVGETVECRADPADAGRIYVFDAEGGFVCVAVDPEREGVSREAIAQAAKAQAAAEIKARKAEIAAAGKGRINRDTLARDILNAAAAQSRTVVSFPRPTEAHDTPGLAESGRAARAEDAPVAPARTQADADRAAHLVDLTARQAQRQAAQHATNDRAETEGRIKRGLALRDAIAAGLPIPAAEAEWFGAYETSSEFLTALAMRRGIDIRPGRYCPTAPQAVLEAQSNNP